ncbi:clostripain-related cysteine peptidase [Microbacterium sp. M3]|uniref:Clostripain-related cysteine peptidase n=1 Tax=Microbacterium arthrosphaerae TaxID=792652 RepID=A0ABU4H2E9_9MICO|nr:MULTISPECIES: clostripain-related cysteine peptidase [Microbacterium]MDW4573506.1 clostripain-related cysteine peptidase [Microbacterium arthrosphaerae]MDW7607361.1 clostripain-related cysteine peptidase [Microbacterium sp. M3]
MVPKVWWWILAGVFVVIVAVGAVRIVGSTEPAQSTESAEASAPAGPIIDPAAVGDVERASWTFLVYMIGDTDLEPYALDDIAEMASVGSTDDVNVVALVDRSPDYSTDPAVDLADWEDTVALRVEQDHLEVIGVPGELNMGDPQTLADFVVAATASFPADNYGLVLWDHGAGWPGVGPDETDGYDVLELAEMDEALAVGLEQAGVDKLDLLGFDACLMSTYEVASVMASHADYMVASQELEPGHGWNYEELALLADDPAATAADLGSAFLRGYAEQAEEWGTGADITLSLLDLAQVTGVQDAVAQLAGVYEANPDGLGPTLARAQTDVLEFGRNPDPELATNQIDLGGYVENLAEGGGPEVAAAAAAVTGALDALVMDETAGPATDSASGLSIYFPEIEDYFSQDYAALTDVPAWPSALSAFFESGDRLADEVRARFETGDDATEVVFDDAGVAFTAFLPPASAAALVEATVSAGYRDGDDIVYVAQMPAALTVEADQAAVSAQYDLTFLNLRSGDEEIAVYQDVTTDPETGYRTIDVPLQYVAAGDDEYQDALISIIVDDEGTILEEDFYLVDEESGTYGAMTPDPDARIYPVALVLVDDEEWEYQRTDDDGIPADLPSIEYLLEDLEPGTTLVLDADVQDYGQSADTVSVEVEIP